VDNPELVVEWAVVWEEAGSRVVDAWVDPGWVNEASKVASA
jgi:hypothetical protein